jgi:non-heme chloroperoxidase
MRRRDLLQSVISAVAGAGVVAASDKTVMARDRMTGAQTSRLANAPFIETADHMNLYYKDWGKGRPVIFVHCWALNSDMWQYQMNYLANKGVRCIAYDRRGHGRSSQPGHGYDYDTLADDLAALIERLELREVTLVGHHMGGGEIIRYLSRHGSGRIARIVLVGAITPFRLKTADNPEGLDMSTAEQQRAALVKDLPRELARRGPNFLGVGLPNVSVSPEMMEWMVNQCLQTSLKSLIDLHHAVIETDLRAEVRKVTVPTLIIHGDADRSAPIDSTGRKTAHLIAGSQLKVYEGAPSGLFITHMDRLNSDLLAFVQGVA